MAKLTSPRSTPHFETEWPEMHASQKWAGTSTHQPAPFQQSPSPQLATHAQCPSRSQFLPAWRTPKVSPLSNLVTILWLSGLRWLDSLSHSLSARHLACNRSGIWWLTRMQWIENYKYRLFVGKEDGKGCICRTHNDAMHGRSFCYGFTFCLHIYSFTLLQSDP